MDIPSIISALLVERGWTQERLAERLKTTQNNVSRWLSGIEPRGRARDELRALAVESGLIEDVGASRAFIPLMGYIGAGSEIDPDFEQVPPDGLDQLELPIAVPDDMIGFQVRGDSMLPRYNDGDVVVVWREQNRATASLIGEEAAVRTEDGRRFLKVIMPGQRRGRFTLESFNARPIMDVSIAWASEIFIMVPARRVRRSVKKMKSQVKAKSTPGGRR